MDEESSVRVQLTSRLGCLVKKSLWGPAPRARGHRDDTGTYAVLQDKGDTDARRSGPGWRPVAGVHGCLVTHSGRGPAGPALRQHPTWGRPARAGQLGSLRGPGPAGTGRFRRSPGQQQPGIPRSPARDSQARASLVTATGSRAIRQPAGTGSQATDSRATPSRTTPSRAPGTASRATATASRVTSSPVMGSRATASPVMASRAMSRGHGASRRAARATGACPPTSSATGRSRHAGAARGRWSTSRWPRWPRRWAPAPWWR